MTLAAVLPHQKDQAANKSVAQSVVFDIMRKGFAELRVDPNFLRPHLAVIKSGMKRITDDPELQKAFPFQVVEKDAYGDKYEQEVGLVPRNDKERKWWFQFTPEAYREPTAEQLKVEAFLQALIALDAKVMEIAIAVAERFDEYKECKRTMIKFPGSMANRIRRGRCISRVLRYPEMLNATNAYPHIDRSALTIHLGSTQNGLVLFGPDGEPYRIDETSFTTVAVFPGQKYAAITRGRYEPRFGTPHGVRQEVTGNEDRYAFVSFIHPEAVDNDVAWHLRHRNEMKAYAESFKL